MPVDQNRNMEAEYLDDSWGMMRELLDKELPVAENKPKPPSKSWLTLLLLILFAWTTYLYWPEDVNRFIENETKETQIERLEPKISPIAHNQTIDFIDSNHFLETNHFIQNENGLTNEKENEALVQLTKPDAQILATSTAIKTNEDFVFELNLEEVAEIAALEDSRNVSPFAKLKSKEFNSLLPQVIESHHIPVLNPDANRKLWSLALKFEGILDRRLPSGRFIGLQAKHQLSNQFAVQLGAGLVSYNKLNPAENSFDAFSDVLSMELNSEQDDLPALSAGMPVKYDDDDDKVSVIGIDKLNYLTVPIELVFSVNKKWSVIAGAGVSYLLSATFTKRSAQHDWISHDNGQTVNDEQALLGTALNRIDIAPSIGFEFRPIERLGVDLRFRNGLIDISKDKFLGFKEFHSNRYLHLGVSYDIFQF